MSLAYHCDRDGCDTWIPEDVDIPNPFVAVIDVECGHPIAHLCGLDCLMHWAAAHSAPTEVREIG